VEKKITMLQSQIPFERIIFVYVIQGIIVLFFCLIIFQILRRRRQRLNLIFSGFFISITIGLIINMIYFPMTYFPMTNEIIIKALNFLTNFFIFFGLIFILIVNLIILESTIIFSVKRQNKIILYYGLLLFFGMLIILIFFKGVDIDNITGYPIWAPHFFICVFSIVTCFAAIPIIITTLKIYKSFETKGLKRKWLYYFVGLFGGIMVLYTIIIQNLLNDPVYRSIILIVDITIIIWAPLTYLGVGSKLKE